MATKKPKPTSPPAGQPPTDDIGLPTKTSISVGWKVWKRAKHFSLDSGMELGQIVGRALDEYLKKHGV